MNKYELAEKNSIHGYVTLHRIRALRDFGDVQRGDIGGWVETGKSLSQEGDCWIYDNARVFRNARMYDDAKASGDAVVDDHSRLFNHAHVYGHAELHGDSIVKDYGRVFGNAEMYEDTCVEGHGCLGGSSVLEGDSVVHADP